MEAQQLQNTLDYVSMLGPDLLPSLFHTEGTAANRTPIRKLINLLVFVTVLWSS